MATLEEELAAVGSATMALRFAPRQLAPFGGLAPHLEGAGGAFVGGEGVEQCTLLQVCGGNCF